MSRIRWFRQGARGRPAPLSAATPAPTATPAAAYAGFNPADFTPPLRTQLLILQPTPFCNIDCDYCYLPHRDQTARMSLATVRRAAERLRDDGLVGDALTVVWHAGEPLAVPHGFYDDAVVLLREVLGAACTVTHSIQTNATLIDDAWCALFVRHGMRIGVSVDGPAFLHDAHRRTRRGAGTHAKVLRGMARLRAHGIGFHAIAVVGPATFANVEAFHDFFVEQGVAELGCSFDEAEGPHAASSVAGHEADHAGFVAWLLDRSTRESAPPSLHSPLRPALRTPLRIRELATALQRIAEPLPTQHWRGRAAPLNDQVLPFALISVAHNGDFGTFSPELLGQPSAEFNDFVLGNVARSGYLESARSEGFQRLWAGIAAGTRECERRCAHFAFCGGGAPANKFYENGDLASGETLYCRTMVKRPFDAVLARLEHDRASLTPIRPEAHARRA